MQTDEQATTKVADKPVRVNGFLPSQFTVVGEVADNESFVPMRAPLVASQAQAVNPLFLNLGRTEPIGGDKRWHLPPDLAKKLEAEAANQQQREGMIAHDPVQYAAELKVATETGFKDGESQATEIYNEKLAASTAQMLSFFEEIKHQLDTKIQEIEGDAIRLAVEIAEHLLNQKIEQDPAYLVPVVREALGTVVGARVLKVRVSPQDFKFFEATHLLDGLQKQGEGWQLVPDESVSVGCIVETSAGRVDVDIGAAFLRLQQSVVEDVG